MSMTPADRSREYYGTVRNIVGDHPDPFDTAERAAHAAWECGYWAAVHDRDRTTPARATDNPFDRHDPPAVEDYPHPAPPR